MLRTWSYVLLSLATALAISSCGDERQRDSSSDRPARKTVITEKGSDTMILLASKWAELFGKSHPGVEVQVTGGGSGTGISALINGTTDIANASRPMKTEERESIKERYGTEVVEIPVAKDGIAIYVNTSNRVDRITIDQLAKIFRGEIRNWKDIGGPDAAIVMYGRENSSGTYEFFKEHVLDKQDFAAGVQTLPGTAAVVNAVSRDEKGIGYGGAAYLEGVKALKLVGSDGVAVEPTEANVQNGTYPLSRNLYFYLRQAPSGPVKDYISWVLSGEGQAAVEDAGYYPLR